MFCLVFLMLNDGFYKICKNTSICGHGNELYNKHKSAFYLTRGDIYENLFYAMQL